MLCWVEKMLRAMASSSSRTFQEDFSGFATTWFGRKLKRRSELCLAGSARNRAGLPCLFEALPCHCHGRIKRLYLAVLHSMAHRYYHYYAHRAAFTSLEFCLCSPHTFTTGAARHCCCRAVRRRAARQR